MTMSSATVAHRPAAHSRSAPGTPARRSLPDEGGPDDPTALAAAGELFRSLGDPTRLIIVHHLALGEHRVVDLTAHLGLAQSTVSAHLACLRDCGLVTSRPQGRASVHSLARPELTDMLTAAEDLLRATGRAVTLCPTAGGAQ